MCWDVYQDTYLDIWVGRVIIIKMPTMNPLYALPNMLSSDFTSIFDLWSLLYYICSHPVLPLLFYSSSLLLLSSRHLAFTSPLAGEFWLLWILMSRSWSLERVDSPSCWSEWRSWSVNPQQTVQSPILPGPLLGSRVFLLWLWASICTVHTCISPCILAIVLVVM